MSAKIKVTFCTTASATLRNRPNLSKKARRLRKQGQGAVSKVQINVPRQEDGSEQVGDEVRIEEATEVAQLAEDSCIQDQVEDDHCLVSFQV
jgi:hypothetical protein